MKNENTKLFYLKKKVLFPHCTISVTLKKSGLSSSLKKNDKILVFPVRYFFDMLFLRRRVSTLAEILEVEETGSHIKLHLKGIERARVIKARSLHLADFTIIPPDPVSNKNSKIAKELRIKAQELIFIINVNESDRLIELINYLVDVSQITDFIGNYFVLDYQLRLDLLNECDVSIRSRMVLEKLQELIEKISLKKE